ncbi:MAG: hypothetical protein R6V39_09965 [Desulfovibrionales bacterium]
MKYPEKLLLWAVALSLIITGAAVAVAEDDQAPGLEMAQQAVKRKAPPSTVDHSKLEPLQKDFGSGPEVTKACLSCHNMAGKQLANTIHWLWLDPEGGSDTQVGKAGLIMNNF